MDLKKPLVILVKNQLWSKYGIKLWNSGSTKCRQINNFSSANGRSSRSCNYPFCTIEPNVGVVNVNDPRLGQITSLIKPQKTVPTIVEFVDIAGLVKGASKGEGLGNQFLGHIRSVNAIVHVVRCFDDGDVVHVHGKVDPVDDIATINTELALADLEVVEKKLSNLPKALKSQNKEVSGKAKVQLPVLEKIKSHLERGGLAKSCELSEDDLNDIQELSLITLKPVLYLCNVDEDALSEDNEYVAKVREFAESERSNVLKICGKLESEISSLETQEEKTEFLEAAGIKESGLDQLTRVAYNMLGLRTYFTAGEKEVRAWTFRAGSKAPQAAGVIHTDFERGFIKAEVFHCEELFEFKSEQKIKEAGKLRIEGKEYEVKDGDIIHFRFNV